MAGELGIYPEIEREIGKEFLKAMKERGVILARGKGKPLEELGVKERLEEYVEGALEKYKELYTEEEYNQLVSQHKKRIEAYYDQARSVNAMYKAFVGEKPGEKPGFKFRPMRGVKKTLPGHYGVKLITPDGKKVSLKRKKEWKEQKPEKQRDLKEVLEAKGSIRLKAPAVTGKNVFSSGNLRQFAWQALLMSTGIVPVVNWFSNLVVGTDIESFWHTKEDLPVMNIGYDRSSGSLVVTHLTEKQGYARRVGKPSEKEYQQKAFLIVKAFMDLYCINEEGKYEQPEISGFDRDFRKRIVDMFLNVGIVPYIGEQKRADEPVPGMNGMSFKEYIAREASKLKVNMTIMETSKPTTEALQRGRAVDFGLREDQAPAEVTKIGTPPTSDREEEEEEEEEEGPPLSRLPRSEPPASSQQGQPEGPVTIRPKE